MDKSIKQIHTFDIPENTSKELSRLHDFLEAAEDHQERNWAISKIDKIHELLVNPIYEIKVPENHRYKG